MIPYIFIKKSLNKFNLVPIILFVLFFTCPVIALAQQRETGRDQWLTLPSGAIRIDSLSSIIAREAGFVLSFNAGKINPGTKMTFPVTKVKLDALLSYLQKHYRLTHKMIGNHIILYNDTSSDKKVRITEKIHKARLSGEKPGMPDKRQAAGISFEKETKSLNLPVLSNTGIAPSFRTLSPSLPKEVGIVLINQNHIPQISSPELALYSERKVTPLSAKPNNAEKQKGIHSTPVGKGNNRFYASAGFTTSEVLYVNPQIKIGLPWLFALATWGTNFKVSGFFYGLGASIKLSDHWDFQLSASSGALSKDFRWPTPTSDTMGRVKTRLTRVAFLAEKHLSKRWTLQFGPVLNFIGSKYSLQDSSIANSFPPSEDVSKDIYILNPPYTLSNSYKVQTGSGKKIWVGFRIGLFYILW
jgi:hypothetical protein